MAKTSLVTIGARRIDAEWWRGEISYIASHGRIETDLSIMKRLDREEALHDARLMAQAVADGGRS